MCVAAFQDFHRFVSLLHTMIVEKIPDFQSTLGVHVAWRIITEVLLQKTGHVLMQTICHQVPYTSPSSPLNRSTESICGRFHRQVDGGRERCSRFCFRIAFESQFPSGDDGRADQKVGAVVRDA